MEIGRPEPCLLIVVQLTIVPRSENFRSFVNILAELRISCGKTQSIIAVYRNKISCAYWLLSVNCLLGSHYLNEGVSHHRQISSLLNRILAPFTCHQENSSITTLRASLPTTIIILSDVFLVDGFLHICPPSEDSLFVARGSILFMPESPDAAQIEW